MFIFNKKSKEKLICPKCLEEVKIGENKTAPCAAGLEAGCYQPFPIRYIRDFFTAEILPIQVFGWSAHGKTVFLDALRLMLLNMRKIWPDYTFQSISQLDMDKEKELRGTLKTGHMPPPTQKVTELSQLDVYIMKLEKMMGYRDKWLVVMDYPGEMFQKFNVEAELMPFLTGANTTFFIISIPMLTDPKNKTGESIDQLMNIYIETMLNFEEADKKRGSSGGLFGKKEGFKFAEQKRQVIVVLTMADMLLQYIPVELRNYLQNDTMWNDLHNTNSRPFTPEDMNQYYAQMHHISNQIREWLLSDSEGAPGGANLVGLLENTGITTHYSMISAVGYDPSPEHPMPIQPRRVLDPFLWALEFDRRLQK